MSAAFTPSPEIAHAIHAAFGGEAVEDLTVMTGGRSGATLLSLTVAGRGYVVRRSDPTRPAHELRTARELRCMAIASERGVAPRLRHVDEAAGVTIMEKVEVAPCARRVEGVARTLRRLHDGPAFPTGRGASAASMAHIADEMHRARGGKGLPEELLATLDELATVTARYEATAPCHNDLNPSNLLMTADRVYFVDWETAGQSDPYVDVGQLGVFAFPTPVARAALLEAYLGRGPTAEEQARADVGRVTALGFYAAAFFLGSAGSGTPLPPPVSIAELLALLATHRETPELAAASLLEEMRRERGSEAYRVAKERLAGG